MKKIILMAETGSDVNEELAAQYDIEIVPMHVNFDTETLDDGAFPVEKIVEYYENTGKLPKTSATTPIDFEERFDELHAKYPEAHILYLAYSAVTTCTYQNALIAAEDRDYITAIDTKKASAGQGAIVISVARILQENPDISLEELVKKAEEFIEHGKMCFLPDNLDFLHAGGRVSNAAYMGAKILSIHPCIEFVDGKLVATKKYRGKMKKLADKLIREYAEAYDLKKDELWLIYSVGLSEEVKETAEAAAKECGFERIQWIKAGAVITTHGGPGAFGLAGFSK